LHGYTRDHVAELRVVLDDGEAGVAARMPRPQAPALPARRLETIAGQTASLIERHVELIRTCRPRTRFNRCGYLLHDVLDGEHLDLARLLIGSEGTLAFFTEASLRTIPLPQDRSLAIVGFASLESALQAAQESLASRPAACELIDRRLLTLTLSREPDGRLAFPADAEAILLIEFESADLGAAREAARALVDRLQVAGQQALYARTAVESEEIDRIWQLRESVLPSLYGLKGGPQPVAFVEDIGVPVEELPVFLRRVQEILRRREITASYLIHAGSGQVHTRPFVDLHKPEEAQRLWAIAEEIHGLALELGGTVSTQHGTGLARTPWVARQYGDLYPVFRELKAIFDPHNLFNPGKIIGPDPGMPAWPLRRSLMTFPENDSWLLHWEPGGVEGQSLNCNGCGHCRTDLPEQRMCPIFRVTHEEAATPRAKANLFRHVLEQANGSRPLSADEVREVADLCINCRMCASECPAHVNVPKLMLEAKAANTAEHGLDRADWTLSRTEGFAAMASTFAFAVNAGLASRSVRWLLEKLFGVSRRRHLPKFAWRNFMRRAAQRGWTRKPRGQGQRVAYFVDVFPNYNDPQMAEAVVAVLHHNGIEVYVPPDQRGCGMAPLAYGDIETAREAALHNLRILGDLAREGYTILCSEPTAALMLREDYPSLVADAEARLVAERVVEFTSFLGALHRQQRLRTDFQHLQLAIGHHVPCHLKALGHPPMAPALLALIPGLRVFTIDVNCSGMAGTFGLKAQNYERSLEAGRPMLDELRRPRISFGSTECSTCRLQMEEGSGKRTLHPAQYLALAYGLMPEIARRLNQPIRPLVLQ
jgi:Fe-S oxidoreductase/FAD/FMN-containing dehydrogenase